MNTVPDTHAFIVDGKLVRLPWGYNSPLPTCSVCKTSMGEHSGFYTCFRCDDGVPE